MGSDDRQVDYSAADALPTCDNGPGGEYDIVDAGERGRSGGGWWRAASTDDAVRSATTTDMMC